MFAWCGAAVLLRTDYLLDVGLFDEAVDRLLPELAARKVLKRIDGPLEETVPATRRMTVRDLLTFRAGWGIVWHASLLRRCSPAL